MIKGSRVKLKRSITKKNIEGKPVNIEDYRAVVIRSGTPGIVEDIQDKRLLIKFDYYFFPGKDKKIIEKPIYHNVLKNNVDEIE